MNNFEYKKLTPFKWFVLENFPFIEADFDALTEWQLFCKIGKEINKIINSQNTVGLQMEEVTNNMISLQEFVKNYFKNLDVQDEINTKLNEMAESGQLADIIAQYLQLAGLLCFNTIEDMKNATNLSNGSFAKTFGKEKFNDGFGRFYKIREINNTDIIDNEKLIALHHSTTLIAELINENYLDILPIIEKGTSLIDFNDINYTKFRDNTSQTDYYITIVNKKDAFGNDNKLELGIANNNINANTVQTTFDFAQQNSTPLAINGGIFYSDTTKLPAGYVIKNKQILQSTPLVNEWYPFYIAIMDNGTLQEFENNGRYTPEDLISAGVKDCVLGFFPLVKNKIQYNVSDFKDLEVKAQRQVIGMKDNNYIILTCEGRTDENLGMNIFDLQRILIDNNVDYAFLLDGGGSTSTVVKGQKINNNYEEFNSSGREVPDFFYINKKQSEIYNRLGTLEFANKSQLLHRDILYFNKNTSNIDLTLGNLSKYKKIKIFGQFPTGLLSSQEILLKGNTSTTQFSAYTQDAGTLYAYLSDISITVDTGTIHYISRKTITFGSTITVVDNPDALVLYCIEGYYEN